MASRCAAPFPTGSRPDHATSRPRRRAVGRAPQHRAGRRVVGFVGVLVLGLSVAAAGLSSSPSPAPEPAGASGLTNLRGVDLAVARRSVSVRPVEGVLLTHAATLTDQARVAAAAAAAAAQAAAAQAAALTSHTGVNWDAIARCETAGNWSMRGSRFSGGLGFANTTWRAFGGGEFASNAGLASREQQIVVAERVYARYGLSGWGCRRHG